LRHGFPLAPAILENPGDRAVARSQDIFDSLHILLASKQNKRILHFADSLQVTG